MADDPRDAPFAKALAVWLEDHEDDWSEARVVETRRDGEFTYREADAEAIAVAVQRFMGGGG